MGTHCKYSEISSYERVHMCVRLSVTEWVNNEACGVNGRWVKGREWVRALKNWAHGVYDFINDDLIADSALGPPPCILFSLDIFSYISTLPGFVKSPLPNPPHLWPPKLIILNITKIVVTITRTKSAVKSKKQMKWSARVCPVFP